MSITILPPEQPFDEADFRRRLMDEYTILQGKIDKIGGFRFTIKGWSVTAVIAISAAAATAKTLLPVLALSIGLFFMLSFFFHFELEQVRLSRLFGNRARELEDCFYAIDRNKGKTTSSPIRAPYSAQEIVQARYRQKLLAKQQSRKSRDLRDHWRRWTQYLRVLKQADIHFYAALIVLSFVLPLAPRHEVIRWHLERVWNKYHQSLPAAGQHPAIASGEPK
jgi:hypothetical protein